MLATDFMTVSLQIYIVKYFILATLYGNDVGDRLYDCLPADIYCKIFYYHILNVKLT